MINVIPQFYKHLRKGRTAFYAIILILLLCVMNISAFAVSYTVEDIDVDVSATNAVEAREKAFEEAQIKGYKMLAERFLSEEELKDFETPDISTVAAYVNDFEVSQEKLSATRYAGVYKISYSKNAFVKKNNTSQQEEASPVAAPTQRGHILVLPFLEDAGYPSLWRSNPFMQAWVRARDNNLAGPSIVPLGNTKDISAIKDSDALQYNPQNLLEMKKRYRAPQAAIVIATPELLPDGTQNIGVGIYQTKSYGPELSRQISVRSFPEEPREQLYARVVRAVNDVFAESWQRKTAVPVRNAAQQRQNQGQLSGPVHTIVAQLGFSTMRQWVDAKKSMERSHGVRAVNVKSLSPRAATVTINYQGSVENLRANFGRNGIDMNNPLTQAGTISAERGQVYQLRYRL